MAWKNIKQRSLAVAMLIGHDALGGGQVFSFAFSHLEVNKSWKGHVLSFHFGSKAGPQTGALFPGQSGC